LFSPATGSVVSPIQESENPKFYKRNGENSKAEASLCNFSQDRISYRYRRL
jgi:hypothetical protein